ncbi:MAG: N-acetyltransferase [Clostridiales bacterium]|nr:N-acetyltransferase [Clostridiales bacterium]
MIRKFQIEDLDRIAEIWLNSNKEAHDFIPASYWEENFPEVKEMLPQAEIYVCENDGEIQGFAGLMEDYIAGIFVSRKARSQGIGRKLLDCVKQDRKKLSLQVYQKNKRAVEFYRREHFVIQSEGIDEENGEPDFRMVWEKEE